MADNLELALRIRALVQGLKNVEGLTDEIEQLAKQASKQAPDPTAEMRRGIDRTRSRTSGLIASLRALASAVVVKEFVDANRELQSLEKSLELVSGSSESAAQELQFIREEAGRLGLDVSAAANAYLQLAAATKGTTLEGAATRDIWSAVSEAMARLGKSSADTQGALLAVSQIVSKGTVSAEELRGQLGERLPGAFQIAARAAGVTTKELGKMLQRGELIAEDFLPKFAAELNKSFGGGGDVISTFNANLSRTTNALKGALTTFGESTGLFDGMTTALSKLSTLVNLVTVGFVSLKEYLTATGKTLGQFAYAITHLDFSGFSEKVDEAFEKAQATIQETAKKIFDVDANLKAAGASGRRIGEEIASGTQKAGDAAKDLESRLRDMGVTGSSSASEVANSLLAMASATDESGEAMSKAESLAAKFKERLAEKQELLKQETAQLRAARTEQASIEKEFDDLIKKITQPEIDDVGLGDIFGKINQAAAAASRGQNALAIETAREGGQLLEKLAEEGTETSGTLKYLGEQLKKVASEASAQNVEAEVLDVSNAEAAVDKLKGSVQGLESEFAASGTAAAQAFLNAMQQVFDQAQVRPPTLPAPSGNKPTTIRRNGNSFSDGTNFERSLEQWGGK